MTNNKIYFVANWKMFGNISSINPINSVLNLAKSLNKCKIIYCPPFTLIERFVNRTKNSKISVGAQDCHFIGDYGAFTGKVSSKQIKNLGAEYIIIGHSENRELGETDETINKKIKLAIKNKLICILCIGENLKERKNKKTNLILKKQLKKGLKNIKNLNNIILAYEPVWAIGTGVVNSNLQIQSSVNFIKKYFKRKKIRILYGGSVNEKNIIELNKVRSINGYLIGSASQNVKKFVDIVKKSIN